MDLDPALKRDLHATLAADGISLKDWFIQRARHYIAAHNQSQLRGVSYLPPSPEGQALIAAEDPVPYEVKPKPPRKPKS